MGIVVMHPRAEAAMAGDPNGASAMRAEVSNALQRFALAVAFLRRLPVREDSALLAYLVGRLDQTLARLSAALAAPTPDLAALEALCRETTDILPLFGYLKQDLVPTAKAGNTPPSREDLR